MGLEQKYIYDITCDNCNRSKEIKVSTQLDLNYCDTYLKSIHYYAIYNLLSICTGYRTIDKVLCSNCFKKIYKTNSINFSIEKFIENDCIPIAYNRNDTIVFGWLVNLYTNIGYTYAYIFDIATMSLFEITYCCNMIHKLTQLDLSIKDDTTIGFLIKLTNIQIRNK